MTYCNHLWCKNKQKLLKTIHLLQEIISYTVLATSKIQTQGTSVTCQGVLLQEHAYIS